MSATPQPDASRAARLSALERARRSRPVDSFLRRPVVARVLAPARGTRSVHKFIRYSMVSAVAIVISQVVILICAWLFRFSGVTANAVGAVASTPASYELNRKWAWGKHGKSHLWREVVPFWALTVAGFLGSTVTVGIADSECQSHHVQGLLRALVIMGASLFAYGVIWIAKFVIFNRLVFAGPAVPGGTALAGSASADTIAGAGADSPDGGLLPGSIAGPMPEAVLGAPSRGTLAASALDGPAAP